MRSEKGIKARQAYYRKRRAKLKEQGRCQWCRAKCERTLCPECMKKKSKKRVPVPRKRPDRAEYAAKVEKMMELAGRIR